MSTDRQAADRQAITEHLRKIPKADLHVHLEGSTSHQTLLELSAKNHVNLSAPVLFKGPQGESSAISPPQGLARGPVELRDFRDFISLYVKISECIKTSQDITLIAERYAKEAAQEGTLESELYVSPATLLSLGMQLDDIFEGLLQAEKLAAERYAHSIRWLFDIVRNVSPDGMETVDTAIQARTAGISVAAIGLGGYEAQGPARNFSEAFQKARDCGFGTTAHAGETSGPESIVETLDMLKAARIGHGIAAAKDDSLLKRIVAEKVCLEVCPWSNVLLKRTTEQSHPIALFFKAGVNLVIGSDDPGIFSRSLLDNYLFAFEQGVSLEELEKSAKLSLEVGFRKTKSL